MSEEKWTPGPWCWQKFGQFCLVGQHGVRPIILDAVRKGMNGAAFRVNRDGLMVDFEPAHANARLIAAAPELAEALANLVESIHEGGEWDEGCFYLFGRSASELQRPLEAARAALAKAMGESS